MVFSLATFVLVGVKISLIVFLMSLILYHGVNIVTGIITAIRYAGWPQSLQDLPNYTLAGGMLLANFLFMVCYSGAIFTVGRTL